MLVRNRLSAENPTKHSPPTCQICEHFSPFKSDPPSSSSSLDPGNEFPFRSLVHPFFTDLLRQTAKMIIYKDILTGDEIISDSYDLKEVGGAVYEADCAMITEGAVNVDTGANASAEEAEEGTEDAEVKVNNIVHSFRLQSTSFDKKGYLAYLKGYMKAVKTKLQEKGADEAKIKEFETGASKYVKEHLLPNFKDFEFYTGESMDPDGMVVLLNYREDGTTPYIVAWKHGLEEMKV
ncbi:translationally-controlled tumor protein [Colletotrichum karsti]|uniref:Translationally-controlled tumor protein homolog n=1 Tax=Colletotrichum karsti TaxID=1095194 RepID=A0A9P6HXL9_9PEZI|nr:translationally-controlled tumor protein [Colletotrichum karsti]KAF9872718.1 translationally-controlled tumor protein [Colletotrichum karsti]